MKMMTCFDFPCWWPKAFTKFTHVIITILGNSGFNGFIHYATECICQSINIIDGINRTQINKPLWDREQKLIKKCINTNKNARQNNNQSITYYLPVCYYLEYNNTCEYYLQYPVPWTWSKWAYTNELTCFPINNIS